MTPEDFQKVDDLFRLACQCDPAERALVLDKACGGDRELRAQVERLLRADGALPQYLADDQLGQRAAERAAAVFTGVGPEDRTRSPGLHEAATSDITPGQSPERRTQRTHSPSHPEQIDGYRIKQVLAIGGMGKVYLAVQDRPRRTVALKVLKPGVSSSQALRRFEYEAQTLARLHHPNIAQVYEAGMYNADEGEVPYFAMEYIPSAKTLTEYAEGHDLTVRERLSLFAKVCDAVHYGHQKGIIHRDLKPANILVDSTAEPRVIDFGVARATDSDLAITTLQTDIGQLVGTVQYMSPEQCDADPHDLDIRSDVYALGVVLYELLCGCLPYDLTRTPLHEAARVIREDDPPRPSTIAKSLQGDVETIALKAMDKNRERRYQSAADLGEDIRRYLEDRPIEARRDSPWYVLRKQVRRHKTAVGFAVSVFCIVVSASFALLVMSELARRRVVRVTRESANAMDLLFDDEAFTDTLMRGQPETAVLDQLERWVDTLDGVPELEAEWRMTIGRGHLKRLDHQSAEVQFRKVIELQRAVVRGPHEGLATGHRYLGDVLWEMCRFEEASACYADAIRIYGSLEKTPQSKLADCINGMASCMKRQGQFADAEARYREALRIRRDAGEAPWPGLSASMNNLATCLRDQGRYTEAEHLFAEALDAIGSTKGGERTVGLTKRNIASCRLFVGDVKGALVLLDEVAEIIRQTVPSEHPDVASHHYLLARLYLSEGKLVDAERLASDALRIQMSELSRPHTDTGRTYCLLAGMMIDRGDLVRAQEYLNRARDNLEALLGPDHPSIARTRYLEARLRLAQGDFAEAEELATMALRFQETSLVPDHPDIADTLILLGEACLASEVPEVAEASIRRALLSLERVVPADNWDLLRARLALGGCLVARTQFEQAEPMLVETFEMLRDGLGVDHSRTQHALEEVIRLYETWGRPEQATKYRHMRGNSA